MATTPTSNGAPNARSRSRSSASSAAKAGPTVAPEARTIPGGVSVAQTAAKLTINRQRIPETVDFLSAAGIKLSAEMQPFRLAAVSKVFLGLSQIKTSLQGITQALNGPALPPQIVGQLNEPDCNPARQVQITFDPSPLGAKPPATPLLTDD